MTATSDTATSDTAPLADRRMLLVHAHPDDESIATGITMAKYVAEGAHVTLITCNLGEEGEVLVDDLAHVASHREDRLAEYRIRELDNAMAHLGVTDYRRLGGDGKYRDTGMSWGEDGLAQLPENLHGNAFWYADLLEAASELVAVIREIKPHVVICDDQSGSYGHPDHIQAHRVTHYAVSLAGAESFRRDLGEAWDVPKLYWRAESASRLRAGMEMAPEGDKFLEGFDPNNMPPMFAEDDDIAAQITGTPEQVQAKLAAMKSHVTQIQPDGAFFAMGMDLAALAWGVEAFRLVKGVKGPLTESGFEDDLFAGIA